MVAGANASGIGSSTNAAANLVLGGGTLQYTGSGASTDRLFSIGTGAGGTIDASGTGAISFTQPGEHRLCRCWGSHADPDRHQHRNNTLAAVVGDNGSGGTALAKSGAGTWVLTGTNTYAGRVTRVTNGTLADGNRQCIFTEQPGVIEFWCAPQHELQRGDQRAGLVDQWWRESPSSANAVTLAVNNAGSDTFSGVIAGAGGLLDSRSGY